MRIDARDLGRLSYREASLEQRAAVEQTLADRAAAAPRAGVILAVEHDPVVTITNRPAARDHLIATPDALARAGVALAETDRGGDITYHGPGQIVLYPILDLNRLHLRLHDYLRTLEQAVIDTLIPLGLDAARDPEATGVWINRPGDPPAKVCAIGVRVRRWVTMHGLALNVTTNLDHFDLIVPCGLHGRPVTSLERELSNRCPPIRELQRTLIERLRRLVLRTPEGLDQESTPLESEV